MATITREDIDALNVVLTVDIAESDYSGELDKELKKYRKHAQLKGFRKGKTPMSVVRKMFGQQLLAEAVNKHLQDEMSSYLYNEDGEKLVFLGQPIPSTAQDPIEFDIKAKGDFTFKFDLGLAPAFELAGVADDHTFEILKVVPDEETLGNDLMNLRRRNQESQEVDGAVEEADIITVEGVELADGTPKEGGVSNEFTLFVRNTVDNVKEQLIGAKAEASINVDIFAVEANTTEKHVRRYLLGLDEEDEREVSNDFQLTIKKISRVEPAPLEQAFFDEAFGEGEVNNEKEALAKIGEDYGKYFEQQVDALLYRDMQEYLMAQNELTFPESFLKRWLVFSNENNTAESVERGFEGFKKSLQWTLIREKLSDKFELEVSEEELRASFAVQVQGYFGASKPEWMDDSMIDNMVERMMGDEKAVRERAEEVMSDKIQRKLKEGYTLQEREVSPEEFNEIAAEARAKAEAEASLLAEEEE